MIIAKLGSRVPRPVRDFFLGLTLFTVVAVTSLVGAPSCHDLLSSTAHARFYELEPVAVDLEQAESVMQMRVGVSHPSLQHVMMASLALTFAGVFALNLWFARNLKRLHAVERRRRRD